MQAYYDEKLKRWIFPGDDPAEVAKPLAPPPTIPRKSAEDAAPTTPAAPASNDPLAMLMAPPSSRSRVPSNNKGGAPRPGGASGRKPNTSDPFFASMGNAPGEKKVPDSPMMGKAAAPPKFTTFQPKPSSKTINDQEGE